MRLSTGHVLVALLAATWGAGCGAGEVLPICGNGSVETGEACDDGNALTESCAYGETACAVCNELCQSVPGAPIRCGDGRVNGEETCDDGNTDTERCAYGEASCAVCDSRCQRSDGFTSTCGDGSVDASGGEECDDGNAVTEACPDDSPCQVCNASCRRVAGESPRCGDGQVQAFLQETCDDGNLEVESCPYGEESCTVCGHTCVEVPGVPTFCGDERVDAAHETCDEGDTETEPCPYGTTCLICDATCRAIQVTGAKCGDRTIDAAEGETCDDGNAVTERCAYGQASCTVCDSTCHDVPGETASCGDGTVQTQHGESCDEPAPMSSVCPYGEKSCRLCAGDCTSFAGTATYCGDRVIDESNGESCDDGNAVSELCDYGTSCVICDQRCAVEVGRGARCGDGVVDMADGEQCDDGNTADGDGCEADCSFACGGAAGQNRAFQTTTGCYLVFETQKSWFEAENTCVAAGMNLATISSARESVLVNGLLSGQRPWVGFSDLAVDGTWLWQSGRPVTYTNWNTNEPNGGTVENCVELVPGGRWNDAMCNITRPFVCSRTACGDGVLDSNEQCDDGNFVDNDGCNQNCTTTGCGDAILQSGEQCDDGNRVDGDGCESTCQFACGGTTSPLAAYFDRHSCYLKFASTSNDAAQSRCASAGGSLVTIDDETENTLVQRIGGGVGVHIGLNDKSVEGTYVWRSGTPVGYTRLGHLGWFATDDCFQQAETGRWFAGNCTNYQAVTLCELSSSTCGKGGLDPGEACDDGNRTTESCSYGNSSCEVCSHSCELVRPTRLCGDGVVNRADGETCDDANAVGTDGCASCRTTGGYTCAGQPSRCLPTSSFVSAGPGLNVTVADDSYNGTLASMGCASLAVPAPAAGAGLVGTVFVRAGLDVQYVGELTLKLVSPEGSVVTLASLPGNDEAVDNGHGPWVYTLGALAPSYPIVFADTSATSAEEMGAALHFTNVCESDGLCDFEPFADSAHPADSLASLAGESATGTWRLCIGDNTGDAYDVVRPMMIDLFQLGFLP